MGVPFESKLGKGGSGAFHNAPQRGWWRSSFTPLLLSLALSASVPAAERRLIETPSAGARADGGAVNLNTLLSSGVSVSFSLPAVTTDTMFSGDKGYRIVVPAGASRLEVRLTTSTPGVDVDLYVRSASDFAPDLFGCAQADYCEDGPTGNEAVTATPCSDPVLAPGTYYIALGLFTTGTAVTGTITATVDGTLPPPPSTGILLNSGSPATFSFAAVESPTLFRGNSGYRIVIPSGATQLKVALVTATANAQVDLYARFGADVEESFGVTIAADHCSFAAPSGSVDPVTITPSSKPPLRAGTYFIGLDLSTTGKAATGTVTATVSAGAGGPAIDLTPASTLDFGTVTVGQTKDLQLSVRNTGNASLTVTSVTLINSQFSVPSPAVPFTLAAAGQQPVTIRFSPTTTGAQTGTLTIASNDPARPSVNVSLQGTGSATASPAAIGVSTPSLNFSAPVGSNPATQTFTVRNTGGGTLNFQVSKSQTWLSVSPLQGSSAGNDISITVSVSSSGLSAGTYADDVRINDQGSPPASPQVIRVTLVVSAGPPGPAVVGVSTTSLNFSAQVGSNPPQQTFAVRNTGSGTLNFQVSKGQTWLRVSPLQGSSTGTDTPITVSVSTSGLAAGAYTDDVRVTDQGTPPSPQQVVRVTLVVSAGSSAPAIGLSTTSLTFSTDQGSNPPPQTFTVRNNGGGTLSFLMQTNQTWLAVFPDRGVSTGSAVTITVGVNTTGLDPGNYDGEIRVSETAGAALEGQGPSQAVPAVIAVRLTLTGTPPPPGAPVIARGGIVNAASFAAPVLPGGAIARGSIFTIFGAALGPPSPITVSAFPLRITLGGVSVRVSRGGASVDAIPLAVTPTQVNAIMPSAAPLGEVSITVTLNGRTSAPVTAMVVDSSFGIFTVSQSGIGPGILQNFVSQAEQPINSTTRTARPGQFITLWGTGLGPINGADNMPPPVGDLPVPVEILVGGKPVTRKVYSGRAPCCAGLDQIVFEAPADAPQGCFVPVMVRAGNAGSNVATMSIEAQGRPCSDPANPLGTTAVRGGRQGVVSVVRATTRTQSAPTQPPQELTMDLGAGSFADEPGAEFFFDPMTSLPPLGTCSVFTSGAADLTSVLLAQLPNARTSGRPLDAGASVRITGVKGARAISRLADSGGGYFAALGGANPTPGQPGTPLFLDEASYTVEGSAGRDVGRFTMTLRAPAQPNWTNRDRLTTVNRSQGATLTWTGGDPAVQAVKIVGQSVDSQANASRIFVCLAPLDSGSFAVPPAILGSLPASNPQVADQSFLLLGVVPSGEVPAFTAAGLDAGFAFFGSLQGITATYR